MSVLVRKPVSLRRMPLLALLIWMSGFFFFTTLFGFVAIVVCVLSGTTFLVERTNSMAPVMGSGDLLFTQSVTASTPLHTGVIAAYAYGPYLITHRIIATTAAGEFLFKGDANAAADPFPVPRSRIQRVYGGSVPRVGGWLEQLAQTWGKITLIAGMCISVTSMYWGVRNVQTRRTSVICTDVDSTPPSLLLDLDNAA